MDIFMFYLGAFLVGLGFSFALGDPELRWLALMVVGVWINLRAVLTVMHKENDKK